MSHRSYIAISVAAALALSVALAPEGWTQVPAGAEFRVNTFTTGQQRRPAVINRANGEFVVTWHGDREDGSLFGVRGQRFDPAGNPVGGEFAVNTYTVDDQYWPAMATNRRNYPRHIKRLRARFMENDVWRTCFTADISVSGIFFESVFIPRSTKLPLEVHLRDDLVVKMVGQPVRGARVPPQLLRVAKGGFAVKLLEAPSDWYEYCLALGKGT